jgi:hypothetical protein
MEFPLRCLGAPIAEAVLAANGKARSVRTYQTAAAASSTAGRGAALRLPHELEDPTAAPLVETLDLTRVARPRDGVLGHV